MKYDEKTCIKIDDENGNVIVLPQTHNITVTAEPKFNEIEMASGKRVRDITGSRIKVIAEYDYVPNEDLVKLHLISRKCTYVTAEYLDIDKRKSMKCSITIPTSGIYTFENDKPYWHNARVELIGQEVI